MRVIAMFSLLLLTAEAVPAMTPLIENGRSDYRIVVAPDAVPAERTAAGELQHFLAEISGVELPIVAGADGPAIYVGQSKETAVALGVADWRTLKPDEIRLKTVGDSLYLAGDRPRGTLYAVYELLETRFGVRFWTAEATDVPKRELLELPQLDERSVPAFAVRSAGYDLAYRTPAFTARLRCNGTGGFPEWGGGVRLLGGVHTFSDAQPLMPAGKYYERHPEWFAERNGRRLNLHYQLCLTNPELRRELTANVLQWLRSDGDGCRYVSVSQNDNLNFCQCARCAAWVAVRGNQADLLLDAVNEVAAAVAKEFPGVLVETLGYQYTRTPPETVRPLDNVIVRYCTIEARSFQPLTAGANRALAEDLTGWHQAARQLMIWNYVTDFAKYYQPHPNWHTIAADLRLFRDCGAVDIYEQGAWNGGGRIADLGDLRVWLLGKLLWNPDRDTDALIDEFVAGYYGPAAGAVCNYLDSMLTALERHPETQADCYAKSTAEWLDGATLLQAWRTMAAACRQFQDDPVYGARVAAAAVPAGCALLERPELFDGTELDYREVLAATLENIRLAGVDRLNEGGLTPEHWAEQLEWRFQLRSGQPLADDGPAPAVAAGRPYHAWAVGRIADLYALNRELFRTADPAASLGYAVRMPNTHNDWYVQSFDWPEGEFELYVEVRCDSDQPSGDAIRIGTYDWNARLENSKDFPAGAIAGPTYRAVEFGPVKLQKGMCIFIAPVVNPAVKNIWIDRLILLPRR